MPKKSFWKKRVTSTSKNNNKNDPAFLKNPEKHRGDNLQVQSGNRQDFLILYQARMRN
jgi:hypothetical protein